MKQKDKRHSQIIDIIRTNVVETQDELTTLLQQAGIRTTQATVSRDIKELQLVKVLTDGNKYKYALPSTNSQQSAPPIKFFGILRDSVISIDNAQNLVILRCYQGMAQGACAAIDSLQREYIVGSIAGDDTIFLATKDSETALAVVAEIKNILNN